ncbi:hypothetical protein BN1325_120190 [Staphylococcus aureus]|uniref:Uncharacterized protein n=1 Tax=Staphylococcus aureus TaxID=1280 RepID=A0A0U1MJ12_STAAU|nr:hypothetical protein BN1321_220014 [Staphylococcus aureus]CRI12775.1 hypothetical protein SAET23_130189 [Staphylococcus aureus]CRI15556.1 hypothetical protein BN1325_120190 [Staphylococcus aureus]CRI19794.1 hypothetical protein SAET23_130189 [Staphylococcus aureus]CRI25402.1 hypothetical protein BN1325_120190 [Staphylococcus aureus]
MSIVSNSIVKIIKKAYNIINNM